MESPTINSFKSVDIVVVKLNIVELLTAGGRDEIPIGHVYPGHERNWDGISMTSGE